MTTVTVTKENLEDLIYRAFYAGEKFAEKASWFMERHDENDELYVLTENQMKEEILKEAIEGLSGNLINKPKGEE